MREHGRIGEVQDAFGVEEREEGVAGAGGGEGGPDVVFEFGYVGGDALANGGHGDDEDVVGGEAGFQLLKVIMYSQRNPSVYPPKELTK